jgi:hypothetical protein
MINMAVPHLGQSGPSTRLGECQAGVQASLAINPSRIVALQTWESCSILLTAIRPCAGTKREATPNTAWQRGAVKARWSVRCSTRR